MEEGGEGSNVGKGSNMGPMLVGIMNSTVRIGLVVINGTMYSVSPGYYMSKPTGQLN